MGRAKPPLDLLAIGCSPDTGPNLNLGAVPYLVGKRPGPDPALPLVCCVTLDHILTSLCSVSAGVIYQWRLGGFIKVLLSKG